MAWPVRLILIILISYIIFCLIMFVGQRRFLFFPQRFTLAKAEARWRRDGLLPWPAGGSDYLALHKPAALAPDVAVQGTLLLFHGNAGSAGDRVAYCDVLGRLGWRVILAEYPGYGAREGSQSEKVLREEGRALAHLVRENFPGRLIVAGESLGAAVAAAVAADPTLEPEGVILITPWDRLTTVAAHHYGLLPVRSLLRDRYDSVAYLQPYRGWLAIVQAENDEIIPAASTLALVQELAAAEPHHITIPSATHNDWFWQVSELDWQKILPPAENADPK